MRVLRVLGLLFSAVLVLTLAGCSGGTPPAPGTFTITVSASSLTVQAGNTAQFTVAATASGNFSGTVSTALTGLPAGVTASPAALTLTPGTPQTVTLTAAKDASASTGTLTITGSAASASPSTSTAAINITVSAYPSFALNVTYPSNNITIGGPGLPLTFTVQPINGFTGSVAVTLSGLLPGVTASTGDTFTLAIGATQIVTLTAASTAAPAPVPGQLSLHVVGSSIAPALPASSNELIPLAVVAAPSFSLAATPATLSLQPGTSGQVSLLATPASGFTSPVAVTVSGLPAGVTAAPASLTLAPGTPEAITLAAASTAAPVSANLTFTGTSGAITQTAPVALTVTGAPTFALGVTEPSNALTAGGAGLPVTIQLTPSNNFNGTVAITLSGLPAGVSATPGTTFTLTGTQSQLVTLTAAATSAPTSATVTVTGTSGTLTQTGTFPLNILAATGPDVTTYHYDNTRQGWNAHEALLTPANVNSSSFGLLGVYPVDGKVDGQPLYLGGLTFGSGTSAHTDNVVFVVTENDSVYALNAATGAQEWKISVLGSGEAPSDARNCSQVVPIIGITSTPVIDRTYGTNGAIFVIGMSKDASGAYHQRLHALDLLTGAELPNSPTEITATYPGTGAGSANGVVPFDPGQYEERASLLLQNGTIYTSWTSHCDIAPYTGWVIAYSEATLKQTSVLNLTPNGSDGAIWMSGYGLAADTSGNIFFADANGTLDAGFNANGFPSQNDFGNAIVKLSTANNSLAVSDYWEPYNTVDESNRDVDLGSGGAMLLPDLTDANGTTRHLVVAAGKDTNIYLADRDNMGKFSGTGSNSTLYQELPGALPHGEWAGPAWFNNTVFFGGVNDNLKAFTITNAKLGTTPTSQSAATFGYPGATPSVSSNGAQNGIVWALQSTENTPAVLHAYDATDLTHELYNSTQAPNNRDALGNGNKFLTPVVSNGMVFVGTPNAVAVLGLLH